MKQSPSLFTLSLSRFSPMAVNSCEQDMQGQVTYSISVLPDEGHPNLPCESQKSFLDHKNIPDPTGGPLCVDTEMNGQFNINLEMENTYAYPPCAVDMDIEKGNSETPKINDEAAEKIKIEGTLTNLQSALQRQISFQIGEKFMQILMNDNLVLPKLASRDKPMTERVHDTTNRVRKYKRSASFNSRKVVLLFSILSSLGTMILIYLTLRVRQFGEGSLHM